MTSVEIREESVPLISWGPLTGRGTFLARQESPDLEALARQFLSWLVLPEQAAPPEPPLSQRVRRIRAVTDWSYRDLADVIGTSHTTVRMFEANGRVTARSRDAAARIAPLAGVLARLSHVASSPHELALALETPVDSGERAIDALSSADWGRAFIVGLDALRGPRPDMLSPRDDWPILPATREMH